MTPGLPDDEASRLAAHELLELEYHWGSAYEVVIVSGVWYARPLDGRGPLTAADAPALRLAIRADYQARQAGLAERSST